MLCVSVTHAPLTCNRKLERNEVFTTVFPLWDSFFQFNDVEVVQVLPRRVIGNVVRMSSKTKAIRA